MAQNISLPAEFWAELERNVSSKVSAALNTDGVPRDLVISYLRDIEIMARAACDQRQTIQIIASARSVLGDRTPLGPADGPFAHALA
ncbi:hypothetical protein ACRAWG_34230 [Methylobacterium sp. P31]